MPDPLTIFERFNSNRRRVPDKTGEPGPRSEGGSAPRPTGVRFGLEELMLLCAGAVALAAASFFLGWYSRGKGAPRQHAREPVLERIESLRIEDLQRALEPIPARYALSVGVYPTEKEARARASSFGARGLDSRVLEAEEGFAVVVGEFADPVEARLSPLSGETRSSRVVRLP